MDHTPPTIAPWNPIRLGVAVPTYALGNIATVALLDAEHCPLVEKLVYQEFAVSGLTLSHNLCYCWGMNALREGRLSHLLLMHSDIRPLMPHWIETLDY
jgi:hypothetical protein